MSDPAQGTARPAGVEDLKLLLRALHAHGVEYLLIGGYALYALGYQRGTVDIDILVQPTVEQGEKVRRALLLLPPRTSTRRGFPRAKPSGLPTPLWWICCSSPAARATRLCCRSR